MSVANIMRGTGIALIVAAGLSLAGCGSCNTPQPQPAAPEQPQQFESAKDRVNCKKAKSHKKRAQHTAQAEQAAAPAAEQTAQQ